MAITKNSDRQCVLVASVDFTYADLTSGSQDAAINMPPGSSVIGGRLVIETAFNSATSDVAIVGDGADDNRYLASASIAATGIIGTWLVTGYEYTAADTIDIQWTGTGAAPTAGAGRLEVEYIIDGRGGETQT